ncbi:hypothetical protein SYYSPA8_13545 [Streptomyces yaizuensis]|uniref:Uncharacterized protein n=1 Tax=Streptomyces yaizuensis TaxID=2989713 RepID=A0ABQ5NYA4_9ACTN|nr:hypothetical protein SYYSPA8_13545 [Streptomyces sp. YSPA8]
MDGVAADFHGTLRDRLGSRRYRCRAGAGS